MFAFIGISIIVALGIGAFCCIISSKKISTEKREKLFTANFIICIVAIIIFLLFKGHLQYFFKDYKETVILTPIDLVFHSHSTHTTEFVEIDDGNGESCWLDYDTNIYHSYVDRENFESYDRYAYFTGDYWNYPFTPEVHVNNEEVRVVSENDGDTGDWVYLDRRYHFELDCPLEPNTTYKIKVQCGDTVETIKIMFHESKESIPSYLRDEIVYYTVNGKVYHRSKKCRHLQNVEHIISGTMEYSGKDKGCELCYW